MKHLLLAIFCFAFSANLCAQKVDTLLHEAWTGSAWVNSERTITTYNSACNIASVLSQEWGETSGTWMNISLATYTYTGANITSLLSQEWNSGSNTWDNVLRISYTYNASSKPITSLFETWTGTAWQNSTRQTITYDANGYAATLLSETWNTTSGSWINSTLITNINNSDGTIMQSVLQNWNIVTSAWDNFSRSTYSYNSDKTIHQTVSETWSTTLAAWQNALRITYTYTASGNVFTQLTESWLVNAWVNSTLNTSTYDGNNYLINLLFQSWNIVTSSWDNTLQQNYTNNGDGTVHQVISQSWNIIASSWLNVSRETYSYTASCGVLPLTLLNLTAAGNNNAVLINWQTENEINTSHFTVQSSLDAAVFTKVGDVPAKGSSSRANSYSFTDNIAHISADKIYYRLVMVDKDEKFVYSKVVSVTLPGRRNVFTIKPNPAKSYFIITPGATYISAKTVVTVSDLTGHVVIKQNVVQTAEQKINISALAKGVYIVSIITSEGVKTQKLAVE